MVRHNGATSSLSWRFLVALLLFFACCGTYRSVFASDEETEAGAGKLYKIEGRVNGDGSSETIILHGNGGRMSVVPSSNGKFELYVPVYFYHISSYLNTQGLTFPRVPIFWRLLRINTSTIRYATALREVSY